MHILDIPLNDSQEKHRGLVWAGAGVALAGALALVFMMNSEKETANDPCHDLSRVSDEQYLECTRPEIFP